MSFSFVVGECWNDYKSCSWICDEYDQLFTSLICCYDIKPNEWILFRDTHYEKIHYGYKPKSLKQYIKLEKEIKKIVYCQGSFRKSNTPFRHYKNLRDSFREFSAEIKG
jgi:hypothetical protein